MTAKRYLALAERYKGMAWPQPNTGPFLVCVLCGMIAAGPNGTYRTACYANGGGDHLDPARSVEEIARILEIRSRWLER